MLKSKRAIHEPIESWLGEQFRLEGGELTFPGCLRVDGVVSNAVLRGPTLVVCEGGKVTGRIEVDRLIVHGEVDVHAVVAKSVVVGRGAAFRGELNLHEPALELEDGVTFKARVRMGVAQQTAAEPLVIAQPQAV